MLGSSLCSVFAFSPQGPSYEEVSLSMGGEVHEAALDEVNSRLYVSIPSLDRVTVINTDDWSIEHQLNVFPFPRGLALTQDGSTLYVAKDGVGGVEVINTSDWSRSDISISSELDSSSTWDVILGPDDEKLYVSANGNSGSFAYIVQVEVNNGNAATRIANNSSGNPTIIRCQPRFEFSPDYSSLYVSECFSPPSVYRLDMTQAGAPIVAQDDHGALVFTHHMEVSPDGSRLYLSRAWSSQDTVNGVVLDAYTLDVVDAVPPGLARFGDDPDVLFLAREPNSVDAWDLSSDTILSSLTLSCSDVNFKELVVMPEDSGFVVLMGSTVCGLITPDVEQPFGHGNLLVLGPGRDVSEFTTDGELVNSVEVEYPGGFPLGVGARGLVVDQHGDLHVTISGSPGSISSRRFDDGEWEHHFVEGWSENGVAGIAAIGDFLFVADWTVEPGEGGMFRIDTRDWSSVSFGPGERIYRVTAGRDGLLYGIPGFGSMNVYDPEDLSVVKTVNLWGPGGPGNSEGFAVDAEGNIFVVSLWDPLVFRCGPDGVVQEILNLALIEPNLSNPQNAVFDPFGNLLIGASVLDQGGVVVMTDRNFDSVELVPIGLIGGGSLSTKEVAFVDGSAAGANYCSSVPNSTRAAARITARGSHSVASDDLTLQVGPIPNNFYIFYVGSGARETPFGNGGQLCVSEGMLRYPTRLATDNTGSMDILPGDQLAPGMTARYQCWFRDPFVGPDYFNTSDGYVIQYVP